MEEQSTPIEEQPINIEIKSSEGQFQNPTLSLPSKKDLIVIVGGNNSGKSTFLREVVKTIGETAYRIDVNRTILRGEGAQNKGYYNSFNSYVNEYRANSDDNSQKEIQTLQDFFGLKDTERTPIIEWYNLYFPNHIYEEREDPANTASPMFLMVNGHSITKQGSGMRATLEIFVKLFDPKIKVLCIDEPEIGLEPYLQKYLFQAIKDKASAEKKIIIATHSHHFLDLDHPANNYICERDNDGKIFLTEAKELKSIIFRLLGNTLSSFLLPERILILEGPSDTTFLLKTLTLAGKDIYSIHNSRGNGNVSYAMQSITQFLRFNKTHLSVYNDKLHVIVDKPGDDVMIREWKKIVPEPDKQICVLSKNGIEYYYPERLLQQIFNTTDNKEKIVDDYLKTKPNSYNNIPKSKTELSQLVASYLQTKDLDDLTNELFVFVKALPDT
ncbi:MAG: hypothetical protein JWO92_889 [Chitinophagaceae bacterium]|nr:hypothetical protein [Chitinophagaceae bacterium]